MTKGQVIAGRYELTGVLGRGGMGTVYEAHDRSLDERVALKVLAETAQGSADADRRFRAEIKLARKIRHPNVCAIHEYGELQDVQYIVMELVTGQDLKKHVRSAGRLTAEEAIGIARQIGDGLQAIHDAGVIHRDLKLSNVMMDGAGRVRLMDFGIAKGIGDTMATVTGQILGTPEYMSPEQVQGLPVDPRADIYSLGIMTYELLTGRVPFKADTPLATIMLHVQEPPRLDDPAIPPRMAPILARALAKRPEDRYASAHEYVAALSAASLSLRPATVPAVPSAPLVDVATLEMATPRPALLRRSEARPAPPKPPKAPARRAAGLAPGWFGLAGVGGAILLAVLLVVQLRSREAASKPRTASGSMANVAPPESSGAASDRTASAAAAPSAEVPTGLWPSSSSEPGVRANQAGQVNRERAAVTMRPTPSPVATAGSQALSPGASLRPPPSRTSPGPMPTPVPPRTTPELEKTLQADRDRGAASSAKATVARTTPPARPGGGTPTQNSSLPSLPPRATPEKGPPTTVSPPGENAREAVPEQGGTVPAMPLREPAPIAPRTAPQVAAPTPAPTLIPVEAVGLLQLGAAPYAQVTVDGKEAGTLPFRPIELAAGRHIVRLVHPNYQPLQRTVTIRPGETTKLFVDWSLDGIAK
jgi:serine/threonine-protein kinase